MNNVLTKKYLIISVAIHLAVLLVITTLINSNKIATTFIVFGAHSKKPSHTFLKAGKRGYVPFVGGGHKKGKGGGKHGGGHHSVVKKQAAGKTVTGVLAKNKKTDAKKSSKVSAKDKRPAIVKKEASVLEKSSTLVEEARGVSVVDKKALFKKNKDKNKGGKKGKDKDAMQDGKSKKIVKKSKKHEAEVLPPVPVKTPEEEKSIEKKDEKVLEKKEEKKEQEPEQEAEKLETAASVDDDNPGATDDDLGDDAGMEGDQGEPLEFNLMGSSDDEMRIFQKSIQKEVTRLWRPPLGVPKGTTCRLLFVVNRIGDIERCEFVTRSKVLIYDLSILRVARQFNFDECLWGKRFTIDFCQ